MSAPHTCAASSARVLWPLPYQKTFLSFKQELVIGVTCSVQQCFHELRRKGCSLQHLSTLVHCTPLSRGSCSKNPPAAVWPFHSSPVCTLLRPLLPSQNTFYPSSVNLTMWQYDIHGALPQVFPEGIFVPYPLLQIPSAWWCQATSIMKHAYLARYLALSCFSFSPMNFPTFRRGCRISSFKSFGTSVVTPSHFLFPSPQAVMECPCCPKSQNFICNPLAKLFCSSCCKTSVMLSYKPHCRLPLGQG